MYYYNIHIALQEVPGEISICFSICGCQIKCKGCHSPWLWKEQNGKELTLKVYLEILNTYKGLASCVLFMGGEWHAETLSYYLKIARDMEYKTCLYTGEEVVEHNIFRNLTWLKTGKWDPVLGGLDSPNTNQKFIDVETNSSLNYLFIKKQYTHDSIKPRPNRSKN